MDPRTVLTAEAEARGFLTAWAPVRLPEAPRARYRAWIAGGKHAGMAYLERDLETRLDPARRFPWVKSVLVLGALHAYPDPGVPRGGVRVGRVARYAWVRDYHAWFAPHLEALEALCAKLGGRGKGYVDHGPIPERSYAVLGGMGWVGRNAMLIRQGCGSYFTLAVLLTSFEVAPAPEHPNRCGRCVRCVGACPTGALLGDGTLDANRCVSYWTIEHRGLIPPELWGGVGEWLFGCDACQEACPWNRKARDFWGGVRPDPELAHPDLRAFFTLSGRAFQRRYAGSAFLRPGRVRMARNALVVLANTRDPAHLPLVRLGAEDVNPLVRATAARALALLGDARRAERLRKDPDPRVAAEATRALEALG